MPRVAQYGPSQVSTQVAQQPRISEQPVDQGGAPGLFKGLTQVAQSFTEMQSRISTTQAEEAALKFEQTKNKLFFDPDSGYFNTQGRDAYDNAGTIREQLAKAREELGASLSDPVARREYDRVTKNHYVRSERDIMAHATKGMKAWEIATINAQTENAVENASLYWNNPDDLRVQRAVGRQAIIEASQLEGVGAEVMNERLQTFESSFATAAVTAATVSSAAEGRETLEKHRERIEGPDLVKLEKMIKSQETAEKTRSDARQATLTATRLVDQYENDRRAIQDEVNQIEDPDLREKTMRESMYLFTQRQYAREEERVQAFESAQEHLFNGGTPETFKAQNPQAWEAMSAKQKQTIESGKTISTDHVKLSELLLLPKDQLAKVDPTDHFQYLDASARNRLITAVKNARKPEDDDIDSQAGRTRAAETSAAVEQMFGKKSKWDDTKREQANNFYAALTQEYQRRKQEIGRELNSGEYTKLLGDFTRQMVIQDRFIFNIDDEDVRTVELAEDLGISLGDMARVRSEFEKRGIPFTMDNLKKAVQQGQQ